MGRAANRTSAATAVRRRESSSTVAADQFVAVLGAGRGLSAAQQARRIEAERAAASLRAVVLSELSCQECGSALSEGAVDVDNPDWDERLRGADGHDIDEFLTVESERCPNLLCASFNQ